MGHLLDRMDFFLNDRDAPIALGFGYPRRYDEYAPPSSRQSVHHPASVLTTRTYHPHRSSRSGSSGSKSNPSDCSDSPCPSDSLSSAGPSTAPSTAPSLGHPVPWHIQIANQMHIPVNRFPYPYDLACECGFIGCDIRFHAEDFEDWIAHSISHFGSAGPPMQCICTICDCVVFNNPSDPYVNWRERMLHIREHFVNDATPTFQPSLRPDFLVVKHLRKIDRMSTGDHDMAMQFTERPQLDNLVPSSFQTDAMKRKSKKDSEEKVDMNKERKQMKRGGLRPTAKFNNRIPRPLVIHQSGTGR